MLPYASDRLPTRRAVVTWTLLAINVALTLLLLLGERYGPHWRKADVLAAFGVVPSHFNPLTLLSYAFLHESAGHLLVNVIYLWVFGGGVEEAVGRGKYLALYLSGGVLGGALQCFMTALLVSKGFLPADSADLPIVGASAACAALVGVYAVRYYRSRIAFVGLPFQPHVVYVIALFLLFEMGSGVWNIITGSGAGGVAHWAHVGGFLFGLTVAQLAHLSEAGERAYLTEEAAQAMEGNTPGSAIKRWEILLAREPNNATARAELARSWLALGDTEQAGQHYLRAIEAHLNQNRASEAALLYAEMRDNSLRTPTPSTGHLFLLGNALEELEQYPLAAETLRAATTRAPDSPATETALLKVITLYVHRLDRKEEAAILTRLFLERYPHSQWRTLAEDLRRATQKND